MSGQGGDVVEEMVGVDGAGEDDWVAGEIAGGAEGIGWGGGGEGAGGEDLFEEDAFVGEGGGFDDGLVFEEAGVPCDHEVVEGRDGEETCVEGHDGEAGEADFAFGFEGCEDGRGVGLGENGEIVAGAVERDGVEAVGAEEPEGIFDRAADGGFREVPEGSAVGEGFAGFGEDVEFVRAGGEERAETGFCEAVGWG